MLPSAGGPGQPCIPLPAPQAGAEPCVWCCLSNVYHRSRTDIQRRALPGRGLLVRRFTRLDYSCPENRHETSCLHILKSNDVPCVPLHRCAGCAAAQSQSEKSFSAAEYPELVRLSARLVGGLRSLHLVSSTGVGSGLDTASVRGVVCAAAAERTRLFSAKQRSQLESWILTNKAFRSLYDGPPIAATPEVGAGYWRGPEGAIVGGVTG